MDNAEFGAGFIFGMIMLTVIVCFVTFINRSSVKENYKHNCDTVCMPAKRQQNGDGLCVCSNGTVYRWKEGYSVKFGK